MILNRTGESRGILGLYCPRVSSAQPWRVVAWAACLPDDQSGGSAQPPRRHAAGSEEENLCERQPWSPRVRPKLSQKDVHPQHHTRLRRHIRGGLQHPRGKGVMKSVLFVLHHRFLYFSHCNAVFLLGCTWIRGQGDVGSTRCQRAQQPISWRRGGHREIPPKCHESGEHPDFGQIKTGRWRKRENKSLCEMIQIK